MNIQNVTQFATFISANNLQDKDSSLLQIVICMNSYKAACDCYKNNEKLELYNTCNKTYLHAVRNVVPKLKNEFLSKIQERQISFYNDHGHLIAIISRQ